MHLVVFSICHNEESTIGRVLSGIPHEIPGIARVSTVVISDGSTDQTVQIASHHGASVIDGRDQRKLAFRFQQAANLALEMEADIAVNIDGDLQFDPADIPKLVAPIVAGEAQMVAADRFTDPDGGPLRRPDGISTGKYYGNLLGARIVSTLTGGHFNDVTCGFRAYSREALLSVNINTRHTYTQESFQVLAEAGIDITTVPTHVTYHAGRQSRVVSSVPSFVATSAINILRSYRDFAPLRFFAALAFFPLVLGFCAAAFVGVRWMFTGLTSPYTSLGLIGVYFFSLGIILLVVGLLADMQVRSARNQEKILQLMKRAAYAPPTSFEDSVDQHVRDLDLAVLELRE